MNLDRLHGGTLNIRMHYFCRCLWQWQCNLDNLQVEEPHVDGADPIGVFSGSRGSRDPPQNSTLYSLRSTSASDGIGLEEWGLLREDVRIYAVFYVTRWDKCVGRMYTEGLSGKEINETKTRDLCFGV